jgi:hypothetical protein
MKSRSKRLSPTSAVAVPEGFKRLTLTGAIVPIDYSPHGKKSQNRSAAAFAPRVAPSGKRTAIAATKANPSVSGLSALKPNSCPTIQAGAVGKRRAQHGDVLAIIAKVRSGASPAKLLAAVYLSPEQREVVSRIFRGIVSGNSGFRRTKKEKKSKKNLRWRRSSGDIWRRGIRIPGSFQSRC